MPFGNGGHFFCANGTIISVQAALDIFRTTVLLLRCAQ